MHVHEEDYHTIKLKYVHLECTLHVHIHTCTYKHMYIQIKGLNTLHNNYNYHMKQLQFEKYIYIKYMA